MVYCIRCKKCKKQYVCQTKRTLKERINEHITRVKRKHLKTEVSKHFCDPNHNGMEDMEVFVMDFIFKRSNTPRAETLRKRIESNWIKRMQTQTPYAMNIMDSEYG